MSIRSMLKKMLVSKQLEAQLNEIKTRKEMLDIKLMKQKGREENLTQEIASIEKKSGSEKEGKAGAQPQKEQETPGQMSEKEALMLLDSYRHEDEPQGLLKPKMPQRNVPEVVKDW